MDQQSLLKDLNALGGMSAVIPLIMSGFAFAYVVGYFLAFDLAWFPFFSLSEHIVFAIRALPIAVAGMLVLLIAVEFPQWQRRAIWAWIWILVLIVAAAFALVWRYPGLVLTLFSHRNDNVYTPSKVKSQWNVVNRALPGRAVDDTVDDHWILLGKILVDRPVLY
jgi:hypothetical protein